MKKGIQPLKPKKQISAPSWRGEGLPENRAGEGPSPALSSGSPSPLLLRRYPPLAAQRVVCKTPRIRARLGTETRPPMNLDHFLPRDATHKRGLHRHAVSVCPSGWVSVTFVYCIKTSKRILKLFHHVVDPPF